MSRSKESIYSVLKHGTVLNEDKKRGVANYLKQHTRYAENVFNFYHDMVEGLNNSALMEFNFIELSLLYL